MSDEAGEKPKPLHMVAEDDPCCAAALYREARSGRLDTAESWTHKKCGCEWRSRMVDGVIRWTPVVHIQIW